MEFESSIGSFMRAEFRRKLSARRRREARGGVGIVGRLLVRTPLRRQCGLRAHQTDMELGGNGAIRRAAAHFERSEPGTSGEEPEA